MKIYMYGYSFKEKGSTSMNSKLISHYKHVYKIIYFLCEFKTTASINTLITSSTKAPATSKTASQNDVVPVMCLLIDIDRVSFNWLKVAKSCVQ